MGRPKGGKNRKYTEGDRLKYVKMVLEDGISQMELQRTYGLSSGMLTQWIKAYTTKGVDGLKMRPGNKNAGINQKIKAKNLTELERLKLENLKLRIENERLKKGYTVKEVNKAHAGLSKKNTK